MNVQATSSAILRKCYSDLARDFLANSWKILERFSLALILSTNDFASMVHL
jgi:hypothetical protein